MVVLYGDYQPFYYIIDFIYHGICGKIERFYEESGGYKDPYNRDMNAEPLIDFAITKDITDKDINYIYRQYVYDKLGKHNRFFDKDLEELEDMQRSFEIL